MPLNGNLALNLGFQSFSHRLVKLNKDLNSNLRTESPVRNHLVQCFGQAHAYGGPAVQLKCCHSLYSKSRLATLGKRARTGSEFPATNFAGVWNGGISGHGSNLPQSSDNTLEALIHVSPSLRISPKEAIGVQIENNRSESVEVFQIDEVMPMNSSAQKPIGENKGKRTGRTKIEIPLEDLLKYDTVKEAALNHNVSESTVDRRIKEYTKGSWSIAKRKEFARKPVSKKGRMQDKNRVLVKVAYEGTKRSFEMPWASKLGELHSLVESSLKLEAGSTYDIQYFDGAEDISIACDANLHCCFANAPRSPRSNSILLNLTDS